MSQCCISFRTSQCSFISVIFNVAYRNTQRHFYPTVLKYQHFERKTQPDTFSSFSFPEVNEILLCLLHFQITSSTVELQLT